MGHGPISHRLSSLELEVQEGAGPVLVGGLLCVQQSQWGTQGKL